jgi:NAD-dependent dihydropyrimidine dehydrogenase PreA subunit
MIPTLFLVPVYALPLLLATGGWACHHRMRTLHNRALLAQNRAAGLAEPPGLHPLIDPARCIGCGACVRACPEHDVIGLVGRVATLIEPWACVGHGTCYDACPTDAIKLVFGTPARGIDVPVLRPGGETSVPGIHIAGELGGLGLIRNAMNQGGAVIGCRNRRLRTGGSGGGAWRDCAWFAVCRDRPGHVGRIGRALPARQSRDDRARAPAADRRSAAGQHQQGGFAGILAGRACTHRAGAAL